MQHDVLLLFSPRLLFPFLYLSGTTLPFHINNDRCAVCKADNMRLSEGDLNATARHFGGRYLGRLETRFILLFA